MLLFLPLGITRLPLHGDDQVQAQVRSDRGIRTALLVVMRGWVGTVPHDIENIGIMHQRRMRVAV